MAQIFEGIDFEDDVSVIVQNENCTIMKVQNETGEGNMVMYDVFPGAAIMYSDFHMAYCDSKFQADNSNLLCIDHCREGTIEYDLDDGFSYFFETGDLTVDTRKHHAGKTLFPLNHFHGVTLCFYLPQAEKSMKKEIRDFSVKLTQIQSKFCGDTKPYVVKASDEIEHIFSELYRVPEKIRKDYFRIKVFELLLFLDALEFQNGQKGKEYFYRTQVEKVKAAQKLLTEDLNRHFTIAELAERFDISQTALKDCFKATFGSPVNSYMQNYRINTAAAMLKKERNRSIAEIAGSVGYDSQSKFTAVFKRIIGVTPIEYRKNEKR
ncbi:helix-turn-helix transcriptional regulator [Roseburia hominis]|uniref:helix-turn-helix domain-containing protein n=1 Tax=Roseburia hominis TaxID=301301 RepID=UPI001F2440DD|nr:helix-turn-helix transcriptional regulator [Roseburia hominis]